MKKIESIVLVFVFVVGMVSCGSSQTQSYEKTSSSSQQTKSIAKNININEFHAMLGSQKGVVVLDVRTPAEVAAGAIEGNIHLDIYNPKFKESLEAMDKDRPVVVYCAVGGRSGQAMQMMEKMGFKEVYNLSGGIRAWQSEGNPVK